MAPTRMRSIVVVPEEEAPDARQLIDSIRQRAAVIHKKRGRRGGRRVQAKRAEAAAAAAEATAAAAASANDAMQE